MRENVRPKSWRWRISQRYVSALLLISPAVCMATANNTQTARWHEQHVTNTVANNMYTVKNVLNYIEKNSNYVFVYNAEVQKMMPNKVRVNLDGRPALQILDEMCALTALTYKAQGNQISLAQTKNAQSGQPNKAQKRRIKGNVSDAKGEPIVGATISEKGGTGGTITDINGDFTLDLAPDNAITISYVGFKPQTLKPTDGIHVTLDEQAKGLDEVVVIGYGTKKKANLIGAVSTVGAEELKDRPVTNLGQMLQGQVPNLNISFNTGTPGEAATLNIRGKTSITNSGAPLVLIDGVEGSIDRINPNDIESVSVLKDAASAAIYGARAGFGVVLITTKNNKDGQAHITYNGRFSFSAPTTKTDFMTVGYDVARLVDEFNTTTTGSSYSELNADDYKMLEERRYDVTENPARPWAVVSQNDGLYHYYGNFDWYHYIFNFAQPTWNHNLSVNGGTEKMNYMISGGMNNHDGLYALSTDKYSTRTLMAKFNAEVTPWLRVFSTASLFKSKYKQAGYDYEDGGNVANLAFHAMPWIVPVNPDGTNVYILPNSNNKPADGFAAMLRTGNGFTQVGKTEQTYAIGAVLKLMEGLEFTGKITYRNYAKEKLARSASFVYARKPGQELTANGWPFNNRLKDGRDTYENYVYDFYANFHRTFANVHNVSAVVGTNYERGHYKFVEPSGRDLTSEVLNDLSLSTGDKSVKSSQNEFALMGYFARLSYDYSGKYLVEANMRYDGTSRFPRNHRWGFFPSLALGWRISEEAFFEPVRPTISNLKLRASIGSLGNQITDNSAKFNNNTFYPYMRLITLKPTTNLNYIFDNAQAVYASLGDPTSGSLTWETIVTQNLGLDVGLFNNRLSLALDVYSRTTKDMLAAARALPAVYGYNAPYENNGELRTNGFELVVGWNDKFNLAGKPFYYGVNLTLADSKTKITKFKGNESKVLGQDYEGMEWGEIWGYRIKGIYQSDQEAIDRGVDQSFLGTRFTDKAGDLIFDDVDGSTKIDQGKGTLDDHGDLVRIGNAMPRYNYGITVNMAWMGFDFSMFWQGIGKQNVYPGGNNMLFWGPYARAYSSFIPEDFPSKVWSKNNRNAYFPRPVADLARSFAMSRPNDRYLQNLAYCRLKNLTVGYTLPKTLTKKVYLEKVRLYFSGENLFITSKLKSDYIDPEQMMHDTNGRVYPFSKTFSFGLDVSF
ncbi:SusC/RagA family TonB-linked outer membrane protein [Hoylesella shahii]|uniref:TonB-linked SusC/RagA family outer membrane protein n=1 Tax=Hoylesella shahii DSM 15611 = JCM 12083 TaxID=1122991 RepID=A0A318HZH0_9BACT|nr:TonB-dependent receptor [Hoylesella shahii]PXX23908.1 TonB-linked SusC/RagA family outer membrane protein [Hoylesella shahii DSM 15611 = JCM 12083]